MYIEAQKSIAAQDVALAPIKDEKKKQKQKGFTLLEVVVVMAIIAILVAATAGGLFTAKDDAKVGAAKTQLMKDFPSAITRILTINNLCTGITTAKIQDRGISSTTVFGTTWSVTGASNSGVTISYPTTITDAATLSSVASSIPTYPSDRSSNINSISASASTLTVSYRCN
tara:strand:+ start:6681 stop:7193 length:513 start_codon:yes stop_codon:yes gene_type:complete